MSIQYSGNAQTSTFTPTTKQNIIDSVGAALIAASWTTVSGGSGTTAWKLRSATTPQGYDMNVLMKDNGGSCVTFSIESTDGVLIGGNSTTVGGGFLIPSTGSTFRIVACKYQAFIFATPISASNRTIVCFGVPYVPSFVAAITTRLGWMQSNGGTDTSTSQLSSTFRQILYPTGNIGANQNMFNSVIWTLNVGNGIGMCGVAVPNCSIDNQANTGYRWQTNQAFLADPIVMWSDVGVGSEAKAKGQLWDSVVSTDAYAGDTTGTFDGHNWICLTDNMTSANVRGTLLVATS